MNQQIASALWRCALLYSLCLSGSVPAEEGGAKGGTAEDVIEAGKRFPSKWKVK